MAIESQGTKIEMGTGSGGAETITAIALGNPTILTSAAHALANGDIVTLSNFGGDDAGDINGQVCIVSHVTTDTFAVNFDSTGKTITDNTDAALATPVTWTEIADVPDFGGPDGTASEIDTTHLGSTAKEFLMGLPDEGSISLSINWEPSDNGQQAVIAARKARTEKDFKITYSDSSTATFKGYVLGLSSSGAVDGKIDGSITIRITDEVTWA
jgi:hypothetical protein